MRKFSLPRPYFDFTASCKKLRILRFVSLILLQISKLRRPGVLKVIPLTSFYLNFFYVLLIFLFFSSCMRSPFWITYIYLPQLVNQVIRINFVCSQGKLTLPRLFHRCCSTMANGNHPGLSRTLCHVYAQ